MLNEKSLQAVKKSCFSHCFVKPLYESYCFSRISDTIVQLLTGRSLRPLPVDVVGGRWERPEIVILFVIDGFGWEFFEGYLAKYPALKRFQNEGVASKITSQFPSTTAAHITSINTGLEVGESGVYEWFYYEPLVDRMIAPLLFSYAGDHEPSTLLKSKLDPAQFYPQRTIYQELQHYGVKSYAMQHAGIAHSPYSQCMLRGAENLPFQQLRQGLEQIITLCKRPLEQPTYIYLYFGDIDSAGHRHGITSPQFADAVESCWKTFEEHFWKSLQKIHNKTAIFFTADHGMVPVDPNKTHYLNKVFPDITDSLKKNRMGDPLVPAGSCRDFFLHVKESQLIPMQRMLTTHLQGIAEVFLTKDLIDQGFFGSTSPSDALLSRIGNLVILPYAGEGVWWYQKHHFEQHFHGAHGGLTREEMETMLLFYPLN
jgi:hypothetical protein